MKRFLVSAILYLMTTSAHAVDYSDARITGIGLMAGEDRIRFTIDKDANAIFVTNNFTGDSLKRVVALITAAYTTQSVVYFIRSAESSSSTTRHYTELVTFSLGSYTYD
jgi:hypothetical protein